MSTLPSASSSERTSATIDIVNVRRFDATCEQIYSALSDPQQFAQWWGPAGFTNTFHRFDFQAGGDWLYTMHGPDGANFDNESVFVEIAPPCRLVFEHLRPYHWYRMTMTLRPMDKGAELTWVMNFEDTPENASLKSFIEKANEENLDRLAAHLARNAI